jgi:hypothetical protein
MRAAKRKTSMEITLTKTDSKTSNTTFSTRMFSLLTHSYYYIGIYTHLICFGDVPEENKTYNLCLAAMYHNGYALLDVPEHLKTAEMCMMAVKNTGYALKYVPESIKTHEMCLIAVQTIGWMLHYVPHLMKTPELCRIAVEKDAIAFSAVPEHMKTYEMCRIAVERDEDALLWVPEKFQTDALISIALANFPAAKRFIKKKITVIHGSPKQMPEKAYDTLEMGYDEDSAIVDGELMVDFHDEFKYGRFYRKTTFEDFILKSKKNPTTREAITEYTIYQAKI